jgi:Ran GTPase-activating protein (RanGAP) involved in mRNA processing and transport
MTDAPKPPPIKSAQVYGLGMIASGRIGVAMQSLAMANQVSGNGTLDQDVIDAMVRTLEKMQEASALILEAIRMIREPQA